MMMRQWIKAGSGFALAMLAIAPTAAQTGGAVQTKENAVKFIVQNWSGDSVRAFFSHSNGSTPYIPVIARGTTNSCIIELEFKNTAIATITFGTVEVKKYSGADIVYGISIVGSKWKLISNQFQGPSEIAIAVNNPMDERISKAADFLAKECMDKSLGF
jgi:hypothetical protein